MIFYVIERVNGSYVLIGYKNNPVSLKQEEVFASKRFTSVNELREAFPKEGALAIIMPKVGLQ